MLCFRYPTGDFRTKDLFIRYAYMANENQEQFYCRIAKKEQKPGRKSTSTWKLYPVNVRCVDPRKRTVKDSVIGVKGEPSDFREAKTNHFVKSL